LRPIAEPPTSNTATNVLRHDVALLASLRAVVQLKEGQRMGATKKILLVADGRSMDHTRDISGLDAGAALYRPVPATGGDEGPDGQIPPDPIAIL
jgi:hypothetical protein